MNDWIIDAACRAPGVDERVFYADVDDTDVTSREQIAQARAICKTCPVRVECLAEAQRVCDQYGVWAGLVPEERKALRMGRAQVTADDRLVRLCAECGGEFAWTTTRWLCSEACERAQVARLEAEERDASRSCAECQRPFIPRTSQVVCSRRCGDERERRRQAERQRGDVKRSSQCAVCAGTLSTGQDRFCSERCSDIYGQRRGRWAS